MKLEWKEKMFSVIYGRALSSSFQYKMTWGNPTRLIILRSSQLGKHAVGRNSFPVAVNKLRRLEQGQGPQPILSLTWLMSGGQHCTAFTICIWSSQSILPCRFPPCLLLFWIDFSFYPACLKMLDEADGQKICCKDFPSRSAHKSTFSPTLLNSPYPTSAQLSWRMTLPNSSCAESIYEYANWYLNNLTKVGKEYKNNITLIFKWVKITLGTLVLTVHHRKISIRGWV